MTGWDKYYGWGRIDAYEALQFINTSVAVKQDDFGNNVKIEVIGNNVYIKSNSSISETTFEIFDLLGNCVDKIIIKDGYKKIYLENGLYLLS